MAIIIGDIHGDIDAVRAFLSYRPDVPHIALGDLVDSRRHGVSFEDEQVCLELLLHSQSELIWGNHDLAYLPERPWLPYGPYAEEAFRKQFQQNRNRFKAALAVDGWLLTHAGVAQQLVKSMPAELVGGGVEIVASWLRAEFERELKIAGPNIALTRRFGHGPLFQIHVCRGGQDHYGGIFWFDPEGEQSQPSPHLPQIFGHSQVFRPKRGKSLIIRDGRVGDGSPWINLNAECGIWIYDTETDELVQIG